MDANIEPTVSLSSVAKSVAETDRRRLLVEEELAQAHTLVEALKERSLSLKESVVDLQQQLEITARAKHDEEAALASLVERRTRAMENIDALDRAITELQTQRERTASMATDAVEARMRLDSITSAIAAATVSAQSVEEASADARTRIARVRAAADLLEQEVAGAEHSSMAAAESARDVSSRIEGARTGLDDAIRSKERIDPLFADLAALRQRLRARADEANAAVDAFDRLIADGDAQVEALSARLGEISRLVGDRPSDTPASPRSIADGVPAPARAQTERVHASPESIVHTNGTARFGDAIRTITLLAQEHLLDREEADHLVYALQSGASDRVLHEAWARTIGGPMTAPDRLIFAELLHAVGDLKAAVLYYEQAATARNSPALVRYFVALAYLRLDLQDRCARVAQLLARDRAGRLLGKIIDALRSEQAGRGADAAARLEEAAATRGFPRWECEEAYYQLTRIRESGRAFAM